MPSPNSKPVTRHHHWLVETLVSAMAQSVEGMTSERPELRWAEWSEGDGAGEWNWWQQPITAGPGTEFFLGATDTSWKFLGEHALRAAGIDDASIEDCLGTWREISGQALSSTAQALGRKLRREVECESGQETTALPDGLFLVRLSLTLGGTEAVVVFGWNEAVSAVLAPAETEPPPAPAAAAAPPPPPKNSKKSVAVENSRTLDLLLEVELPVSVSFGRSQLPLKDVLKLNSGSIVELNRSISEPVEVIVNNCVIARGEVVVVEGNYGVRIKHIISKEERLRTLY